MSNRYCIIMAGGIGSRFWPMSRTAHPKQFLDILGTGRSLLQQTFDRVLKICPADQIYVVTNESYIDLVKNQLPEISIDQILGEPLRRNTAPCIAYATYKIAISNPNANIMVAPSDHVIADDIAFEKAIVLAMDFTEKNDSLVTLGIHPSRPDTGYGYIQYVDKPVDNSDSLFKVKTFTEKPNLDMAKFFLSSGDFLWNAGIFVWSLKSIRAAFEKYLPEMHTLFTEGSENFGTKNEAKFIKNTYALCTNISIDYGIMEKADNVFVLPSEFGWSDLGTWGSLYDHTTKDKNDNAIVGKNVMMYDSMNNIVNVPANKLVVLQGLDGYIVVQSDDLLLVCKKEDEQQIKTYVNDVKLNKGDKWV